MAKTRAQKIIEENAKKINRTSYSAMIRPFRIVLNRLILSDDPIPLNQNSQLEPLGTAQKTNYVLRQRKPTIFVEKKKNRNNGQVALRSHSNIHGARAMKNWNAAKKIVKQSKIQLTEGDIVIARMAGHRPWPGKIESFQKNGVEIIFYGTDDSGLVRKTEIVPFELCSDVLMEYIAIGRYEAQSIYQIKFEKACKEVGLDW